jgi:hypothetical protein
MHAFQGERRKIVESALIFDSTFEHLCGKGIKGHITRLRIEELTKLLRMKHELDNWCVVIAIYDPHIRVFSPELLKCCLET